MTLKTTYATYEKVFLQIGRYQEDDSIAIQLCNKQNGVIATITVCLCDVFLDEGETYIDTNNCPWALDFIMKEGLGKRTGQVVHSGYCTYPVIKFDMKKLKEHEQEIA